jgi:uncharacterized OB-fold protein
MSEKPEKPLPIPNEDTRVLFEGAARGALMIQHCLGCGAYRFVARRRCDVCASPEYEWKAAAGRGKVITFAFVHQRYHPGFYDEIPYNIAVVELDEGPRFITNVVGLEGRDLHGGMPVEVVFEKRGEVSIPVFRPVP